MDVNASSIALLSMALFCGLILLGSALYVRKLKTREARPEEDLQPAASPPHAPSDRLIERAPIIAIGIDQNNRIQSINDFSCRQLGSDRESLLGRNILSLVTAPDRDRVRQVIATIQRQPEQEQLSFETTLKKGEHNGIVLSGQLLRHHDGEQALRYLVGADISEVKELSESLHYRVHFDTLTELANRHALEKHFEKMLRRDPDVLTTALVYFDVDQLKVVNDTCGHTAGDQLLKQLTEILREYCDAEAELFCRIGGDEFAVLLRNFSDEQVLVFSETLRNAAEDFNFRWNDKQFRQSISVGAAWYKGAQPDLQALLSAADAACYVAKENGRNQVHLHRLDGQEATLTHHQDMLWVSRLDSAIKNGEFELYFQPITPLQLRDHDHVHYEVLLRYIDEHGNVIAPNAFLPSAERFGKSTDIDLWVITETLDFLSRHPEHTEALDCCSINLTAQSLASHRTRSAIIALMQSYAFPLEKICFEITESSAIKNLQDAIAFIDTLRALGCRFALDDFGTGFSSFGYLKNLNVDYLKIDGSFVKDVVTDKVDRAMVRALVEIAHALDLSTIAEYVEDDAVKDALLRIDVDFAQGYGIARPMPLSTLLRYYHDTLESV